MSWRNARRVAVASMGEAPGGSVDLVDDLVALPAARRHFEVRPLRLGETPGAFLSRQRPASRPTRSRSAPRRTSRARRRGATPARPNCGRQRGARRRQAKAAAFPGPAHGQVVAETEGNRARRGCRRRRWSCWWRPRGTKGRSSRTGREQRPGGRRAGGHRRYSMRRSRTEVEQDGSRRGPVPPVRYLEVLTVRVGTMW